MAGDFARPADDIAARSREPGDMEIAVERLVLHYSVPFGTARVAASDLRDGAHLTLTDPATRAVGRGEACPDGFYGETVDGVLHDLTGLAEIA